MYCLNFSNYGLLNVYATFTSDNRSSHFGTMQITYGGSIFKGSSAHKLPLTSNGSSMKMDIPYHVLCQLFCVVVTVHGLCTKQNEMSRIEAPGYKSLLVHTNKVGNFTLFMFLLLCSNSNFKVSLYDSITASRSASHCFVVVVSSFQLLNSLQ